MTRARKHSNNKGRRMIQTGSYLKPLYKVAKQLGVQVVTGKPQKKSGM